MKKLKYIIISACLLAAFAIPAKAQTTATLYFMDEIAERNNINPALTPNCKFYFDFVFLPNFYLKAGTNSFMLNNLIYNKNGQTEFLLSSPQAKDRFFKSIRPTTNIGMEFGMNILSFGFQIEERHYVTFDMGIKTEVNASLPKDMFKLLLYGTPDANGINRFNFKSLGVDAILYSDVAVGYMNKINDKWTVGGKAKFLMGYASASTSIESMTLNASRDQWALTTKGRINVSLPISYGKTEAGGMDLESIGLQNQDQLLSLLYSPAGYGAAIDLGATYKPIKNLTVSAAITDLGFIYWNKNTIVGSIDGEYEINELINLTPDENGNINTDGTMGDLEQLGDDFMNSMKIDDGSPYSQMLRASFTVGAEYGILKNKISFGALSRTRFNNRHISEEVTLAANFRPANWFKTTFSYSFVNGGWGTLGLGFNLRMGMFNTYFIADYLPLTYSNIDYEGLKLPVPNRMRQFNMQVGCSWNLGRFSSDLDNDGVRNGRDKCKDTDIDWLRTVCPDLKKKELVDKQGCTIDQDNDSIPDCIDQCPDTPNGVAVDSAGCPLDQDKDGVPDYLDQCKETREGVTVDSVGCPLDDDKDGVANHLDLCAETPANVIVDDSGCPVDTDGDGVPDYLDKCSYTPAEAYSTIDENGCPIDSDKDGVPNYIDKCPDTKPNLVVDSTGCPVDSDNDGVNDSEDKCPNQAGPASNKGCPEVTKEVKNLFSKAMAGIQFETGNDVIKRSSYPILDQIVAVMELNQEYNLSIKGYTDNVGKAELNLELSRKRAAAVVAYLISKGISTQRLTSEGFGDSNPIADNKTAAGRAKNRRVEFEIFYEQITYEKVVNPELETATDNAEEK